MTTKEDEIRRLVAQLREAFNNGDQIEIDNAIAALEEAVAPPND